MKKHTNFDVVYSMKYTKPLLKEVIFKYDEVVLLPLYPHYSFTTYQSSLDELKKINYNGKVSITKPFFYYEDFNKIIANKIINSIDNPNKWNLIFSAHSLPEKMIKKGDRYKQDIENHFQILKNLLPNFKSINLAYQSRFGFSKWLTPYLDKELEKFKNENVLIYPLSFMIDNSETDLELKIEYKHLANKIGIKKYKVVDCPNDDKEIAKFLVKIANESYASKS